MPSEETKERVVRAIDFGRTVLHYGWIPFIIYVGYTRSNPQPSLINATPVPHTHDVDTLNSCRPPKSIICRRTPTVCKIIFSFTLCRPPHL
ncbi:hypothetical protein H4582DRAFT_778680 [Lactarius indigo]|nr:hypothetical protein H4582DRAFT_778680 [Lactarius indigo]